MWWTDNANSRVAFATENCIRLWCVLVPWLRCYLNNFWYKISLRIKKVKLQSCLWLAGNPPPWQHREINENFTFILKEMLHCIVLTKKYRKVNLILRNIFQWQFKAVSLLSSLVETAKCSSASVGFWLLYKTSIYKLWQHFSGWESFKKKFYAK